MENKKPKILVLFVEPMLYIMDLIHTVYEQTPYIYQYVFCHSRLTGKDDLSLPAGTVICDGDGAARKEQVKKIFESFCPDMVIVNGYVGVEQSTLIRCCKKAKVPYAIETDTPLHIPGNKLKAAAKKLYLRTLLHNSLCHGFPGGTLQKENLVYYGIRKERCYIMPMCVDCGRLLAEGENLPDKESLKAQYGLAGKDIFLFVGRLEEVKNVPVLLRAFAAYKKSNPDGALLIVGDGTQTEALKEMTAQLGLKDVVYAGYVVFPGLVVYYKMADIFVLPSSYESWGLVVNEAQAFDLPVVVSSKVGCREDLVISGKNGYIFEDDNEMELRDAMEKALALGKPEISMAQQWNHKKYYEQFVSAVEHICKEKTQTHFMP